MTTVEQYQQAQSDLASQSEAKVTALVTAASGVLSSVELAELVGTLVAGFNLSAAMLADVFTSRLLGRSPLGLGRPDNEAQTLAEAVLGILGSEGDPLPRLGRLGRSEPVQSSRHASREAMQRHRVTHYRWHLDADPCRLCRFLGSREWPVSKIPLSHPNCLCLPVPSIPASNPMFKLSLEVRST